MFDQFKYYKGIIYKITNLVNKKSYIGQTIYSFKERYKGGKWWKYTTNRYLKHSIKKYGFKNFSVEILEYSKNIEELNSLEEKYADLYNTYVPNGYNLIHCGNNKIKHQKSLDLYTKEIILNSPEKIDVKIKNIRKFCRDNGLDLRAIYRVINGRFNSHKGWSLKGNIDKVLKNKHKYIFYNIHGTEYRITGLTDFCKLKGLKYHSMRDMVQGKIQTSQGFALDISNFRKKKKMYSLILEKENELIYLTSIKKECKKFNLHPKYIYDLINGKITSYLGWTIKDLNFR